MLQQSQSYAVVQEVSRKSTVLQSTPGSQRSQVLMSMKEDMKSNSSRVTISGSSNNRTDEYKNMVGEFTSLLRRQASKKQTVFS